MRAKYFIHFTNLITGFQAISCPLIFKWYTKENSSFLAFYVDNRKSNRETLSVSLCGINLSAHLWNTAQLFLWIWLQSRKTWSSTVLYSSPYPEALHYPAILLMMRPEMWGVCAEHPTALFLSREGVSTASQPHRSWTSLRCGDHRHSLRRIAELRAGQSQVPREGWARAKEEDAPLRLFHLREMKCRQRGQALGHSFIYQNWFRQGDLRTFQSTATYFLLLLRQAINLFLVSFAFANDLIMVALECVSASLAMVFEVNCGSQTLYCKCFTQMLYCKTNQT